MLLTRPNPNPLLRRLHLARPQVKQEVLDHYEVAGPDYAYWSRAFNMHFGYFAWGMNPFKLEPMLERMNAEALDRLGLPEEQESLIGDLGCGLGATSRYAARRFGAATVLGFTVVPWQVEQGNQLHEAAGLDDQAHVFQGDFRALPLPDNSLDGVVALESSCYGTGEDKADFLAEVYRVLKPGGRFVVADVFRKHSKPLPGLIARAHRQLSKFWAFPGLAVRDRWLERTQSLGFTEVKAEEISWKVAPSVMHVPKTIVKFVWDYWKTHRKVGIARERWEHVKASFLCIVLGLARPHIGYYFMSGRKPA